MRILHKPQTTLALIWGLVLHGIFMVSADSIKLFRFGPYLVNDINATYSPAGYDYSLTNATYHLQLGWVEPIIANPHSLFNETYIETNANINVSPYETSIGTTFNIKPLRYFEFGLTYNRLLFNNSLISFKAIGNDLPDWRPRQLMDQETEVSGADVFTYQSNLIFDIHRLKLLFSAERALWDIDVTGKDFVYEYENDILLKSNDRINIFVAQMIVDIKPFAQIGLMLKNQYWYIDNTGLEKNLISFGITGFRHGINPTNQKRGLDLSVGYWTKHPHMPSSFAKHLVILADWKWDIRFFQL